MSNLETSPKSLGNRARIVSVIDRAATVAASETFAQQHYMSDSAKSTRTWDEILMNITDASYSILSQGYIAESEKLMNDADERVSMFFIAGATLSGWPLEVSLLDFARKHSSRLVREEVMVLLESNKYYQFRLPDTVHRAYEGKQRRYALDEQGLRRERLLQPLQYVVDPRKVATEAASSYKYPGKNKAWELWNGDPLMALPWYSGRWATLQDYSYIDPNPHELAVDLQYLTSSGILEEQNEGGIFSKKQIYRIKDASQWSGPSW